jgi:hypothetical protein
MERSQRLQDRSICLKAAAKAFGSITALSMALDLPRRSVSDMIYRYDRYNTVQLHIDAAILIRYMTPFQQSIFLRYLMLYDNQKRNKVIKEESESQS